MLYTRISLIISTLILLYWPHLGDIPQVEQVVDLGRCGEEAGHDGIINLDGGLGHHISDRLHLLLEVLQLLVNHGAEDPLDLRFLQKINVNFKISVYQRNVAAPGVK